MSVDLPQLVICNKDNLIKMDFDCNLTVMRSGYTLAYLFQECSFLKFYVEIMYTLNRCDMPHGGLCNKSSMLVTFADEHILGVA